MNDIKYRECLFMIAREKFVTNILWDSFYYADWVIGGNDYGFGEVYDNIEASGLNMDDYFRPRNIIPLIS